MSLNVHQYFPVKKLSSQLTHRELSRKSRKAHPAWFTVSSFCGHLITSQCTHKMRSHCACCELSVSLQLSQWAHCYHCMVSHQMISQISHSKLTVWVWSFLFFSVANDKHIQANSQKAHSNLTVWVIRWALCEYGVSSHLHWAAYRGVL